MNKQRKTAILFAVYHACLLLANAETCDQFDVGVAICAI